MSQDERHSDRNKTDKKEEDYTLPTPLQQIEKLKSKPFTSDAKSKAKAEASGSAGKSETSSPAKVHSSTPVKTPFPVTECDLDQAIYVMEKSIHDTEQQLEEFESQRRVRIKQVQLRKLQRQFARQQKQLQAAKDEDRSLPVTILSDSMPKHVGDLRHTVLQSSPALLLPGSTISSKRKWLVSILITRYCILGLMT